MCAQIMSFIMSIGMLALAVKSPPYAFLTYAALCGLTAIASFFMKQELNLTIGKISE